MTKKRTHRLEKIQHYLELYLKNGCHFDKLYDLIYSELYNYVKKMLYLRFLTFNKKERKLRKAIYYITIVQNQPKGLGDQPGYNTYVNIIKDKMKELINDIPNENHRKAYVLRLCLPSDIKLMDLCAVLGLKYSCFTSWLFRARKLMENKLANFCHSIGVCVDDINFCHFWQLKKENLLTIDDHKSRLNLLSLLPMPILEKESG